VYARNGSIAGGSNFTFNVFAPSGSTWSVFSTTNLTNWTFVSTVTLSGSGVSSFTDSSVSGVPYRFYKLSDSNCCSQAIGFYRVQVGAGTTNSPGTNGLLALQLDSEVGNTLDGLFNLSGAMPDGTPLPDGSVVIKWDDASQVLNNYTWNSGTGWLDSSGNPSGSLSWNVGEAAYLATSNATTVTFVGLVKQGTLSMFLPGGQDHLIGSMLPKAGGLQSDLGYVPHAGDEIFIWTGSGPLSIYRFLHGIWNPQQPVFNVGQGFFWQGSTNTWQVNFSPCQ
jgi:hypothetical protein